MAKLIINTVAVSQIKYDIVDGVGKYRTEVVDASEYTPIYRNNAVVGGMRYYCIDADVAKLEYGVDTSDDEKQVTYAEIYIPDSTGVYVMVRIVHGKVVESVRLPDELQFNPFDHVANMDHAFRDYSENDLEDSEIFNWIDKNDAINANETLSFIVNIVMASPKYKINGEQADILGIKMNSPEMKQYITDFSPFIGQLTSIPIELVNGNTVPDSFYTNLERKIQQIYEDAGIPRFIDSGEGISNVSYETIATAMSMIAHKVGQKKDQLYKLAADQSTKVLIAQGVLPAGTKSEDVPYTISWTDVGGLSTREKIAHFLAGFEKGIYPAKYVYSKSLDLIGESQDIEEVEALMQEDIGNITQAVDQKRAIVQAERETEKQLTQAAAERTQVADIETQISELING